MQNYYAVLGVAPTATHDEIKRAYYSLCRQIHPDKQLGNETTRKQNIEFHQISVAWEVLGNAALRKEYDKAQNIQETQARGVVQEEVDLDDMDYEAGLYTYPCRCSGTYTISEDDLDNGYDTTLCPDCSLRIRVLYEVADEE
ncbi:hypothetical protein EV183_005009 [Coemansia sp. RSA 2336]|nr:hypothetical protein EV183_005009 [Coemansia sp. RSA 2336]